MEKKNFYECFLIFNWKLQFSRRSKVPRSIKELFQYKVARYIFSCDTHKIFTNIPKFDNSLIFPRFIMFIYSYFYMYLYFVLFYAAQALILRLSKIVCPCYKHNHKSNLPNKQLIEWIFHLSNFTQPLHFYTTHT